MREEKRGKRLIKEDKAAVDAKLQLKDSNEVVDLEKIKAGIRSNET